MSARLLVLVGALAGLFTLHGLSAHGASSHDVNAAMSAAVLVNGHADDASEVIPIPVEESGTTGSEPTGPSAGVTMAGLCLAVLGGAISALLLMRPHRIAVFVRPRALAYMRVRLSARRDLDPPCLFELSVLRT